MKGLVALLILCCGIAAAQSPASERAVLDKYCVGCHNQKLKTGGLTLDTLDISRIGDNAEIWERVVRKLHAGTMPPQGLPRPDRATTDSLISGLESALDQAAAAHPNPGRPVLHRMNRAEYGNAIHDLLNLEIDPADYLPPDDSNFGFDNVSNALTVSPSLMDRYLSAAARISSLAVGDMSTSPVVETYRVKADYSQRDHVDGMPLGSRGGLRIQHEFPVDAEYILKARLQANTVQQPIGIPAADEQLEISVDGVRVALLTLTKQLVAADKLEARVPVKAGPHWIIATFLQKTPAPLDDLLQPFDRSISDITDTRGVPHVNNILVVGPYNATGVGDTASRRQIFVCQPTAGAEELGCAKKILSTLARRAYRRSVTDSDLETLLSFYQSGRNEGTFDTGIARAVRRILASPQFIFRFERDPANLPPDSVYRLSDADLATRLSFFIWSSIPDEELLTLAAQGKLSDPATLEKQVRRMLADPRSQALVDNFAGQWLYLRNVKLAAPSPELFLNFDEILRRSMKRESDLFFASIIHEDRNVLDLLNADYTFLDERLARHYGIPGVSGDQFRRVQLADERRRGLLGEASIELITATATRTSPVERGKFILDNILGTPPNPPPPGVPPLKETAEGEKPKSVRELMEQHRANPTCAGCHKIMDPLGFALENFDAVGRWRDVGEDGNKIDASGVLGDGSKVDGPIALRQAILNRPYLFVSNMTAKLLTYALGRGVDYYDMPAVRAIVRDSSKKDYRFSSLILGVVNSKPFQMRRTAERDGPASAGTVALR